MCKNKTQLELDEVVSANECTGACQCICTDEKVIRRYHREFNKKK